MDRRAERMVELTDRAETIVAADDLQRLDEGWGDVVHRRYSVEFATDSTAQQIMAAVGATPDLFTAPWLAAFDKVSGEPGKLNVGDQFVIRIAGPWNGPVEVIEVTETSFALATRVGHMEAGVIEFRAIGGETDCPATFEIESWATSGGPVVWFTYAAVRVTKMMQTRMWRSFCQKVARRFSTGRGDVETQTQSWPLETRRPPEASRRLRTLREAPFNYEIDGDPADDPFWYHDEYENLIGREPPGPPQPDGVFNAAKAILIDYQFPDPSRLVGHFDRDAPLAGRTMVLEAKLMGQRRYFGTRVSKVIDDQPTLGGKRFTRFGWAYRTLDRHYEVGEMTFLLTKDQSDGDVRFAIKAYSRPGSIPNVLDRIAFRLLGRRLQRQFGRRCVMRMRELTDAAMQKNEARGTADAM